MTSSSTVTDAMILILLLIHGFKTPSLQNAACELCRHSPQTCAKLEIHYCITRRSLIYKTRLQLIFPCTSSMHVSTGHLTCQATAFMTQYWDSWISSAQISCSTGWR